MKEFLDNLTLPGPKKTAWKIAFKEVEVYFSSEQNQQILIRNLIVLMGLRNIGVEELSGLAWKHRSYVGRLIRNDFPRFNPSVETLRALADALRIKPSTLVMVDLQAEFQNHLELLEKE